ncbi:ATP-binding protein [Nakamurella leprariae]|uniref:ATP-binding protein n=1 Tax=Nakamurella leprariae TaxID=2803911 RepID=A0A938Y9G1_9ACTN|nr:ATP-binding protein [Nakamurella leprariae]MBM9468496.1 ATP-binding protein [Nakamurella leprariae]
MDPVANPYTPNAGAEPPLIAGRNDQLVTFDVLLRRLSAGRSEQSMIITGLRGVGKTVLLGRFRTRALSEDWVVIEAEIAKHDDSEFRRRMTGWVRTALFELSPRDRWGGRLKRAAGVLKSFSLSIDPSGALTAGVSGEASFGHADHGDLQQDLSDLLVAVGEAAQDAGRGIVLLLDEVQFLNKVQLEAIIAALHKTVQRNLPVTMVGAGLPQIAELAGDAKSYAERLFKFPRIGTLGPTDAASALRDPAIAEAADYDDAALALAVDVTGGYPYFLQELGYAAWGVAPGPVIARADIERAMPIYESKLDESFFTVRLDRATGMQRMYLRAMAELGPQPQKAGDVAEKLNRTSPQVAPTRSELINMGLLYTPEYGYAAFTVPHFDRYMKRAMPELVQPEGRPRGRRP